MHKRKGSGTGICADGTQMPDNGFDRPLLVDIKTACHILDLSRPTVASLIKDGSIKVVHVGKRVLVNYASLVAFSEGRQP